MIVHVAMEHMAFKWMVDRLVTQWTWTLILIKAAKKLERVSVNLLVRGATRQWCAKVRAAARSDRCNSVLQSLRWDSVMMQWVEMTDILAELAECRM